MHGDLTMGTDKVFIWGHIAEINTWRPHMRMPSPPIYIQQWRKNLKNKSMKNILITCPKIQVNIYTITTLTCVFIYSCIVNISTSYSWVNLVAIALVVRASSYLRSRVVPSSDARGFSLSNFLNWESRQLQPDQQRTPTHCKHRPDRVYSVQNKCWFPIDTFLTLHTFAKKKQNRNANTPLTHHQPNKLLTHACTHAHRVQ